MFDSRKPKGYDSFKEMFNGKQLELYNFFIDFENILGLTGGKEPIIQEFREKTMKLLDNNPNSEVVRVLEIIGKCGCDLVSRQKFGNPFINLDWNLISKDFPLGVEKIYDFLNENDYFEKIENL